jgi:hypothetical protein
LELYWEIIVPLYLVGLGITAPAIVRRIFTAFPFHPQNQGADTDHVF